MWTERLSDLRPASDKDIAEFFRLALLSGAASRSEVIAWADSVVVAASDPAHWAIDLSLANDASDFVQLLGLVPGEICDHRPGFMLLGRLCQLYSAGELPGPVLARRLNAMFHQGVFPMEMQGHIDQIDDGFELAETGVWSTAEAEENLRVFLGEFVNCAPRT